MVKVYGNLQDKTKISTKVSIKTIRNQATEYIFGPMAQAMKVISRTTRNTGRERSLTKMVKYQSFNGKTGT